MRGQSPLRRYLQSKYAATPCAGLCPATPRIQHDSEIPWLQMRFVPVSWIRNGENPYAQNRLTFNTSLLKQSGEDATIVLGFLT